MFNDGNDGREQRAAAEAEVRLRDLARRAHPKTNEDFEVLYKELDVWRQAEVQKIKVCCSGHDWFELRNKFHA